MIRAILLSLAFCLGHSVSQAGEAYPFVTDVPGVEEAMLYPDYWLARLEEQGPRMSAAQISAFNRNSFFVDEHMHDLEQFADQLSAAEVTEWISRVSSPASTPRYHAASGLPVTNADYARWQRDCNLDALLPTNPVRWGLVVRRASMRSYPTDARVLKTPGDQHLDRFQETAVFPGERVAIVHQSVDGHWLFAVNYHYGAWLPREAVALGSRQAIDDWVGTQPRLVVTGDRVFTNFNPREPRSSEQSLEMGISLPLMNPVLAGSDVNGQNPYASYIVRFPVRGDDGSLAFEPTLIARSRDVSVGPLAYTAASVIRQSFKFLGERYGWGHDYNGRDCTGFVGEVYKSFGLLMPRNTGQQARGVFAPTKRFAPGDQSGVRAALATLQVGDLLYVPGHVVMFIGDVNGEPYVIHDKTVFDYRTATGKHESGNLSGVVVTPLTPLLTEEGKPFVDSIYAIKRIAPAVAR